ncbi:sensor histidine kinase [Sphingomonas astaxanthinifaciens]|uniref:histidine kinase n=1 Tax=Sphingomonas astaxanthinifaciens DSM 22298 TaxID=1123267 RepID=A0ABQ5Z6N3_9SPHN|nr:HAMP domain-containing sensor histidine kinase [Sphingomonas astaxanthinifaciens]GLR46434.1 sensor protein ChvG [Sphingomonas astaxanthinifaciens DSM 22298]
MADDYRKARLGGQLRWRLSRRILAVNLIILLVLALALLFLDSFRNQLRAEREAQTANIAEMAAGAVARMAPGDIDPYLSSVGRMTGARLRLYGPDGARLSDSWTATGPTYRLRDPALQPWTKAIARALDRGFNALVGQPQLADFAEPADDRLQRWPEALAAKRGPGMSGAVRNAPDLTPVISSAIAVPGERVLLVTSNDRDFTRTVREERAKLATGLFAAALVSFLLSFFLARTIARPLHRLALAAHRVRLGRSREVRVPRFTKRRDEIGLLARAVSDMSQALRLRIDNIEAFAADVTHELKNPLASLRSAVDGLDRIEDPALRRQLLDVVRQDVLRLDRLIGDIGEAARTDAELARAAFEPVDLGTLVGQICEGWEQRRLTGDVRIAFARPRAASAIVLGEPSRLARAIDNLIDNAISFSPAGGLVEVAVAHVGDEVRIRIDDEGPGVPAQVREAIFNRFVSVRPEGDDFGRHSGLGLAIARAIVKGHDGEIDVADRDDAPSGARFTIRLPAAPAEGREA